MSPADAARVLPAGRSRPPRISCGPLRSWSGPVAVRDRDRPGRRAARARRGRARRLFGAHAAGGDEWEPGMTPRARPLRRRSRESRAPRRARGRPAPRGRSRRRAPPSRRLRRLSRSARSRASERSPTSSSIPGFASRPPRLRAGPPRPRPPRRRPSTIASAPTAAASATRPKITAVVVPPGMTALPRGALRRTVIGYRDASYPSPETCSRARSRARSQCALPASLARRRARSARASSAAGRSSGCAAAIPAESPTGASAGRRRRRSAWSRAKRLSASARPDSGTAPRSRRRPCDRPCRSVGRPPRAAARAR